ncbi:MAG: hypothetical protein NT062_14525 [Proteobacteria bacterium]|nr:hypothetical protein [Pseudomonadota bacterium]
MQPQATSREKLVVAHPDRKAQRALQRLVGATLCPVEVVADLDALKRSVDATTIVVIDGALALSQAALHELPAQAWIAVPGEGSQAMDGGMVDQLLVAGWQHIVAHPMPILAEELLATVQKLIRADAFGLEKYVAWGAEVRSYVLADARERDTAVAALARDVVSVGLPERVGSLVSVIADELIANALYAAPVDAKGARFRSAEPRDAARPLAAHEGVTVRWATDARYLAIEVRDRWGTLAPATISGRLASSAKLATADAGMGLPLAYACCNQFVINVAPRAMTEVIALLDVRYKPTELGRSASFHTFVGTAP